MTKPYPPSIAISLCLVMGFMPFLTNAFQLHLTSTQISSFTASSKNISCIRIGKGVSSVSGHHACSSTTAGTTDSRQRISIRNRKSSLSMHMGHSHSHHHHHNDHKKPTTSTTSTTKKTPFKKQPTTLRGKILDQISRRGKAISIIFAAVATILPALLFRQRKITKTDIALFTITSTAITLVDKIRIETKYIIDKAKGLRDGFMKHAPPKISASQYLFRNDNAADRVTLVGVVVNLVLSLGKGLVGINCHSSALVADAGHSLSDLFSDFITLWAVQIARLPPDDDHPYGHGKFEGEWK